MALLGVSRPTLWEWRRNGRFPEPLKLGPRRIAWLESDVKRYIEDRDRERRA